MAPTTQVIIMSMNPKHWTDYLFLFPSEKQKINLKSARPRPAAPAV
jgi:hypothetical protein